MPVARVEALDAHQGPIQRLFGVQAVEVQTGAAGKGGEISLPALTAADVRALREATGAARAAAPEAGPRRRLAGRDLLVAALTAGQMGIIVPVLAGAFQLLQQLAGERGGEQEALSLLPGSALGLDPGRRRPARRRLAALHARRAGGVRRLHRGPRRRPAADPPRPRPAQRRDGHRRPGARDPDRRGRVPRRRSGWPRCTSRSPATPTSPAPRARCSRSSACATSAPLLDELLPELADDPLGLAPPPRRALRRYLLVPTLTGLAARRRRLGRRRRPLPAAGRRARARLRLEPLARRRLAPGRRPPGRAPPRARPHDRARARRATASRTPSPSRCSSAAPRWPTSRSRSARAPTPASATSTRPTPARPGTPLVISALHPGCASG